jgi:hypothetical protein
MKLTKPLLIGFTGFKKAGKDTAARLLHEQFTPYKDYPIVKRIGFADELKKEVATYLQVTTTWIEERKNIPEIRVLLQRLGTEKREIDDQFWIKKLDAGIDHSTGGIYLIPDVRFLNEANFIHCKGGCVIYVENRKLKTDDSHISETEHLKIRPDYRIPNNTDRFQDLEREVKYLYVEIKERYKL